jgi:hypothetical protein
VHPDYGGGGVGGGFDFDAFKEFGHFCIFKWLKRGCGFPPTRE